MHLNNLCLHRMLIRRWPQLGSKFLTSSASITLAFTRGVRAQWNLDVRPIIRHLILHALHLQVSVDGCQISISKRTFVDCYVDFANQQWNVDNFFFNYFDW
jgi:hypothetical protein